MEHQMDWARREAGIPKGGVRTRFAPSPTGYMHVGNLRTALYTWLIAKHFGGTFILRIEDTDQGRLVEEATEVIYRTLAECGLDHQEGPDIGGPVAPYIQSQRQETYGIYAQRLLDQGGAYRCFCTKERLEQLREQNPTGGYDGHCAHLSPEEVEEKLAQNLPYVIRQRIPSQGTTTFHDVIFGQITVENSSLDDQILIKADGMPTYNFANVVDDHLMGITHVVRGSEYLSSAPKYNLLYQAFGWEVPTYIHCSPVMRDGQHKMSKRHGDPSYEDLKAQGFLTQAILNYVALLGWSPRGELAEQEMFTLEELVQAFDLDGMSRSPAIFDLDKLKHFNAHYLRAMSPQEFCAVATPYIQQGAPGYDPGLIAPLLQARCETLAEIPEKIDFFAQLPLYSLELFTNKKSKCTPQAAASILPKAMERLAALDSWTEESIRQELMDQAQEMELKHATVMWPVRIGVAGKSVTPGGAVELCYILGQQETLRRLQVALEQLEEFV